tara:strand:- start:374 stop:514 length:141 start_codon:yes stop_codon:yes gene_type:complete
MSKEKDIMEKVTRMNAIRYELCNDDVYYMDILDEFVDLAIEVNNND